VGESGEQPVEVGAAVSVWKNRVKNLTMEVPEDLLANPMNMRRHPGAQRDAMRGSLDELGWIAPVVVNDVTGRVVDGHLRIEEAISEGTPVIPVIHVDLTEAQERLALAVFDPIGSMARNDSERLDDLLASISTSNESLQALLDSLQAEEIDSAPIHGGKSKDTASFVILFEDSVDQSEFVGCLALLSGNNPADKLLRVMRNAIS